MFSWQFLPGTLLFFLTSLLLYFAACNWDRPVKNNVYMQIASQGSQSFLHNHHLELG